MMEMSKTNEWENSRNYGFCCILARNMDSLPINRQIRVQKAIMEVVENEFVYNELSFLSIISDFSLVL